MRKFLISVIGAFVALGAIAAGDNTPTSKSYVDAAVAQKQDKISANDGAPMVLTNTGTAGEYGTKGIYDATGEYATQQNNLVDAVTMNTAVQNAIDSEFQCIEWLDPNDHSSDCLLFNIFGETGKSILPTGYTALEYIESTGTQYIDTGVIVSPLNRDKLKIEIKSQQVFGGSWRVDGIGGNGSIFTYLGIGPSNTFAYGNGISDVQTSIVLSPWNINVLEIDYKNQFARINGEDYKIYTNQPGNARQIFYLFTYNNNGGVLQGARKYYLTIWEDDKKIRDMIPARRNSDGKIGMYDTVTNSFFTNAGTGEFIAGPVANMNLYLSAGN